MENGYDDKVINERFQGILLPLMPQARPLRHACRNLAITERAQCKVKLHEY